MRHLMESIRSKNQKTVKDLINALESIENQDANLYADIKEEGKDVILYTKNYNI